jgi:DNA-binding GntR family transcriptional regulator
MVSFAGNQTLLRLLNTMPRLQSAPQENSNPSGKSLTLLAFDALRADIIACRLAPSQKLGIQALAKRYSVGVTAIREALSRLVADGLVEATDQRGFRVTPVSKLELLDLTETRIAIESIALAKAIELGDVAWESKVVAAFHQLSRHPGPVLSDGAGQSPEWPVLHEKFHESLISGCNSPWLMSICKLMYEQSERYRHLSFDTTPSTERSTIDEHRELMDATIDRDKARALSRLENHFRVTTDFLLNSTEFADRPTDRKKATGT